MKDYNSTDNLKKIIPVLSGSSLKIIAFISMIVDHCAYYLMEENTILYETMRCIGRIAFPVFAFLVVEGFRHTRNRMSYFLHLLGFAAVSELPWYLLNGADGTHNVMFTLALGVVALAVFERLRENRVICCGTISLIMWFATWIGLDYEWRGIFMIVVFYLLGGSDKCSSPSCRMFQLICTFPIMMHYGVVGALLSCMVLYMYDGTRGFIQSNWAKYGFYAFYPLHLISISILLKECLL